MSQCGSVVWLPKLLLGQPLVYVVFLTTLVFICRKVLSIDEYASYFDDIDPLSSYKAWKVEQAYRIDEDSKKSQPRYDVHSEIVKGVFVVSDPVDWGRDIQVHNLHGYMCSFAIFFLLHCSQYASIGLVPCD